MDRFFEPPLSRKPYGAPKVQVPDANDMIAWARKDGLNVELLKINGRYMTYDEIFARFPIPPPHHMWGSPAGHLKQYKPFGGKLDPKI